MKKTASVFCFKSIFLLVAVVFNVQQVYASDLEKEQRWVDQVVDSILDGDAEFLNDGVSDFLTIYTEAADESDATVIIMHGTGIHPDWQQVIQPLRVDLTEEGWNTLSIQMPILHNEATYDEYAPLYDEVAPRINAAIKFVKEQGAKKIVLIGHSQGAAMASYYLRDNNPDVTAFAAIGIASNSDPRMNSVLSIEKIKVPTLDLYGTEDLEEIIGLKDERVVAAKKAGNTNYQQKVIKGNHFFDGEEEALVAAVAEWLGSL